MDDVPSACADFVDVSQFKLEHPCIILKGCLAFELERISF